MNNLIKNSFFESEIYFNPPYQFREGEKGEKILSAAEINSFIKKIKNFGLSKMSKKITGFNNNDLVERAKNIRIYGTGKQQKLSYNPFEIDFLLELSNLKTDNYSEILRFLNEFGPLGLSNIGYAELYDHKQMIPGSLFDFIYQIEKFKYLTKLADNIKQINLNNYSFNQKESLFDGNFVNQGIKKEDSKLEAAIKFFEQEININLISTSPYIKINDTGDNISFKSQFRGVNILSIAYYNLYNSLTNNNLSSCKYCHKFTAGLDYCKA
ncbi:hypothetical protein SAMN04488598_1801, partial [Halanaerobium congolense]